MATVRLGAQDNAAWRDRHTTNRAAIDRHWSVIPPQTKEFIFDSMDDWGHISLGALIDFWTSPDMIRVLRSGLAGKLCNASWYLTLVYLGLNSIREARALMINGAFLHQWYNCGSEQDAMEDFRSCRNASRDVMEARLPYFVDGLNTTRTTLAPRFMRQYIQNYLPDEHRQMMWRLADRSSGGSIMSFVDQVSDDWDGPAKGGQGPRRQGAGEGSPIQLMFEDDADGERHSFGARSSTPLKTVFGGYAEVRGASLRSLRFSYRDKTLFLSGIGKKTPKELDMRDGDVVKVHRTGPPQETPRGGIAPASDKAKAKKSARKKRNRAKKKSNKKEVKATKETTEEELKIEHSKALGRVHDEARPRLERIRRRLNNLAIERSPPKKKSTRRDSKIKDTAASKSGADNRWVRQEGLGGKAGRTRFVIQVGEAENLHRTAKPSAHDARGSWAMPILDLHGFTRQEALAALDGALGGWVETAMRGSYPFVTRAKIVCGGGNQALSEAVEEWIRSRRNVSHAPRRG